MPNAIVMHEDDNVASCLSAVAAGDAITLLGAGTGEHVVAREAVPYGHKIATAAMKKGSTVLKYGLPIGRATADIEAGAHVHVHNVESLRARSQGELR